MLGLVACTTSDYRLARKQPGKVATAVYDEFGRPQSGSGAARFDIVGLQADPLRAMSQPQEASAQSQDPDEPQDQQRAREAELRTRFGSDVIIRGDQITKRYFLGPETGTVFLNLVKRPGEKAAPTPTTAKFGGRKAGEKISVLEGMLGEQVVELTYFPDFEPITPLKMEPAAPAPRGAQSGYWPTSFDVKSAKVRNSLLLVTAKASALAAFEDALNLFFANVPQVEIEVKVVEFTTSDALSFGVSQTGDPEKTPDPTLRFTKPERFVQQIGSSFPLTAPFVGVSNITDRLSLTLGGSHNGWELSARIEALQAIGKADVLSSPKVVVRNGGTASILTQTDFPFPKARITSSGQNITSDISFKPVGINLGISPVIAGTETVILRVFADVSAVTSFAATEPVPTPIVSRRQAVTSVHVPSGKTTIIGGLTTSSTVESESKVPILGDIPLLGFLFRSTSTNISKTDLQFFITPRIIRGAQGSLIE